jgi:hypothetical protein
MTTKTGRIYKIVDRESDVAQVGSTFNRLSDRLRQYKISIHEGPISKYMEKYGAERFEIILIKEYQVVDHKQLSAMEQLWINKLNCINEVSPFRLDYAMLKKQAMEYSEDAKTMINASKKRESCACGAQIRKSYRKRHLKTLKHTKWVFGIK